MLIALAYCQRDQDAALQLFQWMIVLGTHGHKLLLLHDKRCDKDLVKSIHEMASESFEVVRDIEAGAKIDDWPMGANYFMRVVATEISYQKPVKYFLWMEPDSIPIKSGWIDTIEAEYLKSKRPFMGARVEVNNVPLHMSGIGMYPNPIVDFAGEIIRAHEVAWDVAAADQIVPQAHFTKQIDHAWKHPTFTDLHELETQIGAEAVLFHASKDGSLIKLLREQKGGDAPLSDNAHATEGLDTSTVALPSVSRAAPTVQPAGAATVSATSNATKTMQHHESNGFTCDIFIRTYPQDYPWLEYCLKSIHKFCTGFRKIWIISPKENPASAFFDPNLIEWKVLNEESDDGYLSQQIHKLYADVITNYEADYILNIDSDTLFTKPTTPQDFFLFDPLDGEVPGIDKLIWYYTPYEFTETPWQPITEKFIGKPVANEFMRRLPMVIPKWLYPKMREYCFMMHKQILSNYIKNQPYREFSEFNAIGAFAYEKFRDKFEWVNTHEQEIPERCARQFQSWQGVTDEVKKEIDAILGGCLGAGAQSGGGSEGVEPTPSDPNPLSNLGDGLSGGNGVAGVTQSSPPAQTIDGVPVSTAVTIIFSGPRDHINALADYADLPWKRQYVIKELKKKFKSKRKKKIAYNVQGT